MKSFVEDWLGTIFAPRETFASLSARPAIRRAGLAVLLAGLIWAGLFAWLAADGRAPSFTRGLPFAADGYYATARWMAAPLVVGLWLLFGQAAQVLCAHRAPLGATLSVLGFAYAVPLTVAFLIPDLVVYGFNGHVAIGQTVRVTAPITLVWVLALTTLGLRVVHRMPRAKALRVAVLAFVVQAVPAAFLLR